MEHPEYPPVEDPSQVGSFAAKAFAGGGYFWDAVLEYRVWCYPRNGAEDIHDGSDYFYAFDSYTDALTFSRSTIGAREPLALVRQDEYVSEPEPGVYIHVREVRITEWPVEYLLEPRRTEHTIPDFLLANARPKNRLLN